MTEPTTSRRLKFFFAPLWTNPNIRRGCVAGLVAFVVLKYLFGLFVHRNYGGDYHAASLPSWNFRIPQSELDRGLLPIEGGASDGWDGQFYVRIANHPDVSELFLETDVDGHPNRKQGAIDNPTYRYQRIGVPLIAYLCARITGHDFTYAHIYHTVQIALTAMGFGLLFGWLPTLGLSSWWSLTWVGATGVLHPLSHGLPDPSADAFLILTLITIHFKRIWLYALASSTMSLSREGYVLVAFVIFLATFINRYDWNRTVSWFWRCVLTALPGILVLGWAIYLSEKTGIPIDSDFRSPRGLYGGPFVNAVKYIFLTYNRHDMHEFRFLVAATTISFLVLILCIRNVKHSVIAIAGLVYTVLTVCTGWIIWETISGHAKIITGLIPFGLFCLQLPSRWQILNILFKFALIVNLVLGANRFSYPQYGSIWNGEQARTIHEFKKRLNPPVQQSTENDPRAELVWSDPKEEHVFDAPLLFKWVHRERLLFTVKLTNHSNITWYGGRTGDNSVCLGIVTGYKNRKTEGHVVLPKDIAPGETVEVICATSPVGRGDCSVKIGLLHEGRHWFSALGKANDLEFIIKVR